MTEGDAYKQWRAQLTRRAETLEGAAIESGNQALKALLLLNGGACVAILGFLASTLTNANSQGDGAKLTYAFVHSLSWFGSGAGFAVGASCLAYLCNSAYANGLADVESRWKWRLGQIFNWLAVLSGLLSLSGFWFGLRSIYRVYF